MDMEADEEKPTIQQVFDETWGGRKKAKAGPDLFQAWKADPTPDRLRTVVESLNPVIDSSLMSLSGRAPSPTLRQRARLLAAKAVRSYDPSRGAKLNTHVMSQLQALQRIAPTVIDPFPAPEKFRLHSNAIRNAMTNLTDQIGREPTDEEIAEQTGLPLRRVIKLRSRQRGRVPMSVAEESDDDEGFDVVGSERSPYDDWVDAVYHDLGDQDRLIMQYRTGYRNAQVKPSHVIARELGVSPATVSQRAARIQAKLDQFSGRA